MTFLTRLGSYWLVALLVCTVASAQSTVYRDVPYLQDYSVKYYSPDTTSALTNVVSDRNGRIQILSSTGLWRTSGGQFQYPGTLVPDQSYRPMADRVIKAIRRVDNQFVYLDSIAIFSNAWAGKLFIQHGMPDATLFCETTSSTAFAVSNGTELKAFQDEKVLWELSLRDDQVRMLRFDKAHNRLWVLGNHSLSIVNWTDGKLDTVFRGTDLTCFELTGEQAIIGTKKGYYLLDTNSFKPISSIQQKLPCPHITAIASVQGNLWFGSTQGAFMLRPDGKFNYYYGERWLPGNTVTSISDGPDSSVLLLTNNGLGCIQFELMTLEDKAFRYEQQVRQRHIRYGFNCDEVMIRNGDLSTTQLGIRESDNLWTSMYLVSQLFRYKVTGDQQAWQNCLESFDAMERLFTITGMDGFFSRGIERRGFQNSKNGGLNKGWNHANDPAWDWRGTTSSDQTVGQMFTLTLIAELMDGDIRKRAITLMDKLMTNIVTNDWYLIDTDGKPTLWGKWNPNYVNGFPINVGDRKLSSSNIIGFLQAAYHFTKKPVYKQKAYELIEKHGYLTNLLRPMKAIGYAPTDADAHSKELSDGWNHSDDEMYFLGYWCLYPYAFTPELKAKYAEAINDHWQFERPEKNGLWNLSYAMTGAKSFDLSETIWYLQEFPLDMIEWPVLNSHRQDLVFIPDNFRGQTTQEVLPPDERPELKHNRNLFRLDRPDKVVSELSAGDTFLLPYWMGRYLGVISSPTAK